MHKMTIPALVTALMAVPAHAQEGEVNRFEIVISVTGDQTFLLNTANGEVWQLIQFPQLQSSPRAWQPVTRIESAADWDMLVKQHGRKPATKGNDEQ